MRNQALDVTACILSLNRPEYLRDAVASVLAQTHAPKDMVIFDNGSKSDVLTAVEEYLKKGVRWQGVDVTRTVFWNFRRAVVEAKTKYVFMMHDDDRLCSDFLDKQINFLEKNPDVVAVSCNGYLIDENGIRNGRLLMPDDDNSEVELYVCSGDVALKYASDSCIPFSPIIYRSEILGHVDLREEYEKVCDAVFLCDIAEVGTVAYQPYALYECRVHAGQDSSYFSPAIMAKLENFFGTRKTKNERDMFQLRRLLITQHTSRNLRRILQALTPPRSLRLIYKELRNVGDGVFSLLAAVRIISKAISKRVAALWKNNSSNSFRSN
jgi:glycosyltransferase involved in cell wall biosynthesis